MLVSGKMAPKQLLLVRSSHMRSKCLAEWKLDKDDSWQRSPLPVTFTALFYAPLLPAKPSASPSTSPSAEQLGHLPERAPIAEERLFWATRIGVSGNPVLGSFYLSLNKFQPDVSMRWPDSDIRRHGVCRPQEIIVSHSSVYTTQPQYLHCYYSENINRARRKLITATIMPSYFCTTRCLFLTITHYPTFTSA